MIKIMKYTFYDLTRSTWLYLYFGFYVLLTVALFSLSSDASNVILSLMNIILILVPLVATLFGVTYSYHTREFTELLLAQPLRRTSIFAGQFFGLAGSLAISLLLGVGLPGLFYGVMTTSEAAHYFMLLGVGVALSLIFCAIAMLISLRHDNRIRGFGIAVLTWLFYAVIYDGLLLLGLASFNEYPLEKFALGASIFNPIDLARILITMKLDIAALMGYTGAVFQKFLGSAMGTMLASAILIAWIALPLWRLLTVAKKKDF